MKRGFAIGCHHFMDKKQRDYVIAAFDEFMSGK
jgi:hypothetical protein